MEKTSTVTWSRAIFDTTASVKNTQKGLDKIFRQEGAYPEFLELDCSACEFIEPAALMIFLSLLVDRHNRNLKTRFILPKSKHVRDFLRVWEFPDAIRKTTRMGFHTLVPDSDLQYFGENATPADLKYAGRLIDNGINRLISDRFFSFLVVPLSRIRSRTRAVMDESDRWEERLVRSVLAQHLQGPDGYVASRIVFESMMNSIRHPNGNFIVTASMFDISDDEGWSSIGHLTLLYWDDGTSMVTTLKQALEDKKPICTRASGIAELYSNYRFIIEDTEGRRREKVVNSEFVPDLSTEEPLMLLSTTFPGITRDVTGEGHIVHDHLKQEKPDYALPGMGLYVLVNTVVDIFGGSIAFRTKNYFMNIKRASSKDTGAKYRAKVKMFSDYHPSFLGNMLTIRLPIRGVHDS